MDFGQRWPNTPDRTPLWWLAAEIIAESNEMAVPDDTDPRLWCVEQWPHLHDHWMTRIAEYVKSGPLL